MLPDAELSFNRLIPTEVKVAVWKRDHGKCVSCGRRENLHYDHNLPYSSSNAEILRTGRSPALPAPAAGAGRSRPSAGVDPGGTRGRWAWDERALEAV